MRPEISVSRLATVCTTLLLGVACAQPMKLATSDAPVVLAKRTITAPNPGEKGTHAVKFLYYGSGTDKQRPEFRDSVTYKTSPIDASVMARMDPPQAKSRKEYWGFDNTKFPLNARVWYPEGNGPFPLVLVVHGNHDMKDFSDPGYAWLGELLASRGFILASIDENFLNGSMRNENDARGWMLLKHLELWRMLNDSAGKPLQGKVDMSRIALMGHSRGGEAVAIAGMFNRLTHYPDDATLQFNFGFDIKGLVAIAPVDGQYRPAEQPTPLQDISYLVIHGSHDGDVSSFSGLTQYNRIKYTTPGPHFKSAIWMYRANHGQWNTVWNDRDNGDYSVRALNLKALVSGEEQRQFGRVIIGGFLEAVLNGKKEYRSIFRDHRVAGDWLPPTMYQARYADANTRWLATFDEDVDVTTGTAPGVRIDAESLSVWKENDVQARWRGSTFRSNVATLGWNNTPIGKDTTTPRWPARVSITIPDSIRNAWNVDAASALLLTVGTTDTKPGARKVPKDTTKKDSTKAASDSAKKPAAKSPKPPAAKKPAKPPKDTVPPDFSVQIEDAYGKTASVPLSQFGPVRMPIEAYVYRRKNRDRTQFNMLAEPVMTTYVLPLSNFTGVDVKSIKTVRLVFDRKRSGQVLVDDVGLTRF
jgi:dienelactone hydrolase